MDTVYTDVNDHEGLAVVAEDAKRLGYVGKFVISPKQVDTVHRVFTPAEEDVAYARQVVERMGEARRQAKGVAVLNGRMIDLPVYQQACHVLEAARAAGIIDAGKAGEAEG